MGATVYDLEEAELCYAPPVRQREGPGATLRGWSQPMSSAAICRSAHWDSAESGFLLDVREPLELAVENVPGALNIPLGQLRARLGELPRDREIHVICRSGQRAYIATRILLAKRIQGEECIGRDAFACPQFPA